MGLFKKIKKKVKKIVSKPKRVVAAVATGGASEVARKIVGGSTVDKITNVFIPTSLKQIATSATVAASAFVPALAPVAAAQVLGSPPPVGTSGGMPMNLGNVLQGFLPALNTLGGVQNGYGTAAQIGSSLISGFFPASGPVQASVPQSAFPVMQTSMAAAPIIRGATSAITEFVAPILARMSQALGKNITLRAAMIIIRRLGKTLGSPSAVAAAVGLSLSELSSLLTANAIKGSSGRRMNPGNVRALRRAHRRIKSFHKLCGDNDRLRAPRRRSTKVINTTARLCK